MEPLQRDFFKVVHKRRMDENRIFMLSDSPQFLEEKWKLIREYTLKVDPNAPIAPSFVLLDTSNLSATTTQASAREYKYMISLHDIFPRVLASMYGDHSMVRFANCHSTALMMAGVLPGPYYSKNYHFDLPLVEKLNRVSFDTLSSGDFVNIRFHVHSFVFLDHDISLTADGCGAPIVIAKTSAILKRWGVKEEALKIDDISNEIEIYRKVDSWKLPEELMGDLVSLYRMGETPFWYETPSDIYHVRVRTLYQKISLYIHMKKNDAGISYKERSDWKRFFEFFESTHIPQTLMIGARPA